MILYAIEEFLDVSVQEFRPSIRATVDAVNELKQGHYNDELVLHLEDSASKLNVAFSAVKEKIKLYHSTKKDQDV